MASRENEDILLRRREDRITRVPSGSKRRRRGGMLVGVLGGVYAGTLALAPSDAGVESCSRRRAGVWSRQVSDGRDVCTRFRCMRGCGGVGGWVGGGGCVGGGGVLISSRTPRVLHFKHQASESKRGSGSPLRILLAALWGSRASPNNITRAAEGRRVPVWPDRAGHAK